MKKILLITVLFSGCVIGQSLKQNYNVEQKVNGGAKDIGEYNFVEYSVKSSDGKELYQIVDKVDYDIPFSKLEVFENGSSLLINAFYGRLTFISDNGTKVKSSKIRDNLEVEYERSILSVGDKKSVLIIFRGQNKKSSIVQRYNENGNLEKEFEIPITNVNGIAFSESLNQIYLSHIQWENSGKLNRRVTLLNTSGEVVESFNANFEKGFFTEDNQFIAFSNKSVLSINTANLELKFIEKLKEEQIVLDVTYLEKETLIAFAKSPELENGKWYYKNPTIKRIDSNGNEIKQLNYEVNPFSEYKFIMSQNNLEFVIGEEKIIID